MKNFKYTVKDDTTTKMYEGEIEAYNILRATEKAKEKYAIQLVVKPAEISIVHIEEV